MFYDPRIGDHHLPRDPFKSLIVPRPIGWISSVSGDGVVNLAPFSFFNGISTNPAMVMFCPGGAARKDTLANVEATGEFVVNLATWDLREQMSASSVSAPPEVDEFEYAGLTPTASKLVKPPRVAESPVHLECVFTKTVELLAEEPDDQNVVVFGKVVGLEPTSSPPTLTSISTFPASNS